MFTRIFCGSSSRSGWGMTKVEELATTGCIWGAWPL